MAPTIEDLEAMSDAEVRRLYNEIAQNTAVGLQWYSDEINRRAVIRQTVALVRLTWFVAFATAISVALVGFSTFH